MMNVITLPIKTRWLLKNIWRNVKRWVFLVVLWLAKRYTILRAYVVGLYRYMFFFKIGKVYVNNYNTVYYKYTGGGIFLEGNKIHDYGFIAIETPGKNAVFGIFAMGFLKWKLYRNK